MKSVGNIALLVLVLIILFTQLNLESIIGKNRVDLNNNLEYRSIYSSEITSLNYLITSSASELSIVANIVDSLIEYDEYGIVRPALAIDWTKSYDNTVWTFSLRENVKWIKYDGKEYDELTADDFLASMEYILDSSNKSLTANIAYGVVKNGEKYYKGEINDFNQVGIKALDKYTLEYTLERPVPYFLSMLTYGCFFPVNRKFLNEVGDKFGTDNKNLLYNGPYILETFQPQYRRELVKNARYWDANKIFINKLIARYNKEATNLAPEMFLRGEIDAASISSTVLNQWIKDRNRKDMIRPNRTSHYSFFYLFNFDPKFDPEYEPENWKLAVNNRNFRKALFHGLDREAAMLTSEPLRPKDRIHNTITPKNFVDFKGVDYTQIGALGELSGIDTFDNKLAIKHRDLAIEELKGKVKFPIKVLIPYNTASLDWANRSQVIEQQMENLLGKEFIDIIIEAQPPTGFLQNIRRDGKFAMLESNWGPDYADPETFTDPFVRSGTYNKPHLAIEYIEECGLNKYEKLVEEAKEQYLNIEDRYVAFAKAEAFLIKEALVLPFGVGGGGYIASRLNPFNSSYSPFGISTVRFKGQKILGEPMNTEEYIEKIEVWQKERLLKLEEAR